jgi:hypothetical protein
MLRPLPLLMALIATSSLAPLAAAQTSIEVLTRVDRYWGGSVGFTDDGTQLSFRPFRPEFYGIRLSRASGATRVGIGAGLSRPNLGAEDPTGAAASLPGSNRQTELDLELAQRLLAAGPRARIWGYIAPMLTRWEFEGAKKWAVGGSIGLEAELDVTGALAVQSRISLAAQSSPLPGADVPEGYSADAVYRRSIGIGVRYRL